MSVESDISQKRERLTSKIQALRAETMKHSHVSRDGKIKVDSGEPLAKLNAEITEVETQISRIDEALAEINTEYEKFGIINLDQLNELGKNAYETVRSGPVMAWDAFKQTRGEGKYDNTCRTSWLPGDLVREPGYAKVEGQIREDMNTAKEAEATLRESRDKIMSIVTAIEKIPVT